jgi:hypothetical protein
MGMTEHINAIMELDEMLPAIAQGAIGIACRTGDKKALELLAALNHDETHIAVNTERSFLAALDGSCRTPIAGLAVRTPEGKLAFRGLVSSPDGKTVKTTSGECEWSNAAGVALAKQLGDKLKAELPKSFFDNLARARCCAAHARSLPRTHACTQTRADVRNRLLGERRLTRLAPAAPLSTAREGRRLVERALLGVRWLRRLGVFCSYRGRGGNGCGAGKGGNGNGERAPHLARRRRRECELARPGEEGRASGEKASGERGKLCESDAPLVFVRARACRVLTRADSAPTHATHRASNVNTRVQAQQHTPRSAPQPVAADAAGAAGAAATATGAAACTATAGAAGAGAACSPAGASLACALACACTCAFSRSCAFAAAAASSSSAPILKSRACASASAAAAAAALAGAPSTRKKV